LAGVLECEAVQHGGALARCDATEIAEIGFGMVAEDRGPAAGVGSEGSGLLILRRVDEISLTGLKGDIARRVFAVQLDLRAPSAFKVLLDEEPCNPPRGYPRRVLIPIGVSLRRRLGGELGDLLDRTGKDGYGLAVGDVGLDQWTGTCGHRRGRQ